MGIADKDIARITGGGIPIFLDSELKPSVVAPDTANHVCAGFLLEDCFIDVVFYGELFSTGSSDPPRDKVSEQRRRFR